MNINTLYKNFMMIKQIENVLLMNDKSIFDNFIFHHVDAIFLLSSTHIISLLYINIFSITSFYIKTTLKGPTTFHQHTLLVLPCKWCVINPQIT